MNRIELLRTTTKKSGISPIIATLLLILIAIAAGVIVYAYVIGFVGNSTNNSGNTTSIFSIENFCVSATTNCAGKAYAISLRNVGSTTIAASSTITLYFTDTTGQSVGVDSTNGVVGGSGLAPGSAMTCTAASLPSGITGAAGHTISVKAVASDGGAATSSTKELS